MAMDNGNGKGGQDSPGSKGSSSSSSSSSKSGGLGGQNSPAGKNSGGGASSTSSKSSSTGGGSGGGLNSAGNRASGAGPGASSNRSTTGNNTGGGSGLGGQNSPAGMSNSSLGGSRASSPSSLGGQNSPAGMANSSLSGGMAGGMAARSTATPGFTSQDGKTNTGNYTHAPNYGNFVSQDERSSLSDRTGLSSYNDNARRADLAQQARAAENKSMGDMATWGQQVKSVAAAGPGWTSVTLNNGITETRKGDRASRNNNPGNIESTSWTASQPGYVGTDGRFAVFSSKEDGINAIGSLLGTPKYSSKTVGGAIGSWAPPSENNTAAYASTVASKIGVSTGAPMSSLTSAQRTAMAHAIMGVEGNTGYAVSQTTGTDRFAAAYMGGATPSTPSAAPAPDAAKPSRSMGQKIAAGAIDVGLGMLPGVGIAASLVNGGLALTGNKTLGENVVDSFVTGTGGAGPDSSTRSGSGGLVASKDTSKETARDTSTVPGKTEEDTFESRYMAFVDPTPRPTPAERWNYNTPGYS